MNIPLSFNPCFSGYGIQTSPGSKIDIPQPCFNPCFSGYGIQTTDICRILLGTLVSILVFLDMEFRLSGNSSPVGVHTVSILVFLDMEFRPYFLKYPLILSMLNIFSKIKISI